MNERSAFGLGRWLSHRWGRLLIVLIGIVAAQCVLYGPSLVGKKILLPLDILAQPIFYLPVTPETSQMVPQDHIVLDLVTQWEPARQQAGEELRAGRLPMWTPYQYAGAPVVWPKFSPFFILKSIVRSPVILAWVQLIQALVAGVGFYIFCRRVLKTSFWASAIPAWCYPLTGFFIFWQGFPTCGAVFWLPWLLLTVDRAVRRANLRALVSLAVITGLVLVSGALDVAGQTLLIAGLFAMWCWVDEYHKRWFDQKARHAIVVVGAGWLLGFLLATPYVLPTMEYSRTGARMERRAGGEEDRPPFGLVALPQTVLPDMLGTSHRGSLRIAIDSQNESSAAIYSGIFSVLLVAPLAWFSRRHRSLNIFWCLLVFFGVSWCSNIPGMVTLLRLPGLNMMSHNRLVFAASFAILAMTAIGLQTLERSEVRKHWLFWIPVSILVALFVFCVYRAIFLFEPLATEITAAVKKGVDVPWIKSVSDVERVQVWFSWSYLTSALLCGIALLGWLILWLRPAWQTRAICVLGFLLVGDLLWFGYNRNPQTDPAFYYPRIPALEQIARAQPGRVIGFDCLPATLAETHGLRDIRGYDAIDPKRLIDLMDLATDSHSPKFSYAMTQWYLPRGVFVPPDGVRLSPVLDMLDVRYVIFRGAPKAGMQPAFQSDDYWVLINPAALPRVFIPTRVEVVTNDSERLEKLASPQFNPRAIAYVESPLNLTGSPRGAAEIVSEDSTHITISTKMETPGLLVLADLWDKGWHAILNGNPAPILRVNHAIRGVVISAGESKLEFFYRPASFILGLQLAGLALAVLLLLVVIDFRQTRRSVPA